MSKYFIYKYNKKGVKMYYNYIYLDPRKPGKYTYEELNYSFLYEPFYVGKGKGNRYKHHLHPWSLKQDSYKNRKLKNILKQYNDYEILTYVIIIKSNNEQLAFEYEERLIELIGTHNSGGILTNIISGGRNGSIGSQYDNNLVYDLYTNKIIPINGINNFRKTYDCRIDRLFVDNLHLLADRFCKLKDIEYFMKPENNPYTKYTIFDEYNKYTLRYKDIMEFCNINNISRDLTRLVRKGGNGHINGIFVNEQARDEYYREYTFYNGIQYFVVKYCNFGEFYREHKIGKDIFLLIRKPGLTRKGFTCIND